ncbi:MAG TPA: tRNA uridine-5-carboxymethylaminomethyl(34) synthesis GTPase MnmE [Parachlamydiaceae bacterium]|nr:tRNA uridine-5-carboxymethylaminomethyl(34) synthesis GTPase MnmE [Parachlamydiaceae bacterium]
MEFIHQSYQPGETVAAIATPPGEGGVAIIRISGNNALEIASKVFSGPIRSYKSHTVHYGIICNSLGERIDDVLIIPMLGRRSYTGEDTIEIHCHGGSLITRRVFDVVLQAGARAARPGEFTFKAFINGKIDLAQAEAVQELIGAKNERALDAAEEQLQGKLSQKVGMFQSQLTHIAAILEAWVDFPEEGLEFATMEDLCADLSRISHEMQALVDTFHDGRMIHEGISLCLIGAPNVGKSSLMNTLLDKERAIVSHIPGTTRDILEDHMRLNGLNFKLMDTAGIRITNEVIEQEGIRRSKEAMQQADLILLVLDASKELDEQDLWLLDQMPPAKTIAVWNKIDLPHEDVLPELTLPHITRLSARQKTGIDTLHQMIDSVIWKEGPPSKEEVLITNVRHKEALIKSIEGCKQLIEGLQANLSPEFLSIDMRQTLGSLGLILGTDITEDVLTAIFSTFCIGK